MDSFDLGYLAMIVYVLVMIIPVLWFDRRD